MSSTKSEFDKLGRYENLLWEDTVKSHRENALHNCTRECSLNFRGFIDKSVNVKSADIFFSSSFIVFWINIFHSSLTLTSFHFELVLKWKKWNILLFEFQFLDISYF